MTSIETYVRSNYVKSKNEAIIDPYECRYFFQCLLVEAY